MTRTVTGFRWHSTTALVVVGAGATISLNDFLVFPTLVGQNGGGAFLILYVVFLLLLGLPLMIGELLLGRISRADPGDCLKVLAQRYGASDYWKFAGYMAMIAAVLIAAVFSVIAGWSLAYFFKSAFGFYHGMTLEDAGTAFDGLVTSSGVMALWHMAFLALLACIVSRPVQLSLQKLSMLLVPGMLLLLLVLVVLGVQSSGFGPSIQYLLHADFSLVDSKTPMLALQRAFYTLALGAGVMIALGRYLPAQVSIGRSASLVIVIDLLFAVLVGFALSALTFSSGVTSGIHEQFVFRVLPVVLGQFGFGQVFCTLFFLLLVIAALTTSIALVESPIGYFQRQFKLSRRKAAGLVVLLVWLLGLGVTLSYSIWHDDGFSITMFSGNEAVRLVHNAGLHDVLVFLSSYLLQPMVALCLCFFSAWIIPREVSFKLLALPGRSCFEAWNYLARYITPLLLLLILFKPIGLF